MLFNHNTYSALSVYGLVRLVNYDIGAVGMASAVAIVV